MRVIPVVDIKDGRAVRAMGGNRENYLPLDCVLCKHGDALELVQAYRYTYGAREFYVADLDAIAGDGDNLATLKGIADVGPMMVDAGVKDRRTIEKLVEIGVRSIIIASETLEDLSILKELLASVPDGVVVVVSCDTKNGQFLAAGAGLRRIGASRFVEEVSSLPQVGSIIFLDLGRVGMSGGPDLETIDSMRAVVTKPLLVGGGTRNIDDLRRLAQHGVDGVLIGTALYDGRITPDEISSITRASVK